MKSGAIDLSQNRLVHLRLLRYKALSQAIGQSRHGERPAWAMLKHVLPVFGDAFSSA
jgi:hypothetical protein